MVIVRKTAVINSIKNNSNAPAQCPFCFILVPGVLEMHHSMATGKLRDMNQITRNRKPPLPGVTIRRHELALYQIPGRIITDQTLYILVSYYSVCIGGLTFTPLQK